MCVCVSHSSIRFKSFITFSTVCQPKFSFFFSIIFVCDTCVLCVRCASFDSPLLIYLEYFPPHGYFSVVSFANKRLAIISIFRTFKWKHVFNVHQYTHTHIHTEWNTSTSFSFGTDKEKAMMILWLWLLLLTHFPCRSLIFKCPVITTTTTMSFKMKEFSSSYFITGLWRLTHFWIHYILHKFFTSRERKIKWRNCTSVCSIRFLWHMRQHFYVRYVYKLTDHFFSSSFFFWSKLSASSSLPLNRTKVKNLHKNSFVARTQRKRLFAYVQMAIDVFGHIHTRTLCIKLKRIDTLNFSHLLNDFL